MPKVFQIGFNKCGTRSIAHFLRAHGLKVAHYERGDIAFALEEDRKKGRKLLEDWSDFDAFLDMEFIGPDYVIEGYRWFEALHADYPNALFILNDRSDASWVNSRLNHDDGAYAKQYMKLYGFRSKDDLASYWLDQKANHHAKVKSYFEDHPDANFIHWNLEAPDFDGLADYLKMRVQTKHWQKIT